MSQGDADLFEALRAEILERLVAIRGSIDPAFERVPEEEIRKEFDLVLGRMGQYLANEDGREYGRYTSRWVALRMGEGFAPETLIQTVVAIGDVAGQISRRHMEGRPEYADFLAAVSRTSFVGARLMVDNLAQELDRRRQELGKIA